MKAWKSVARKPRGKEFKFYLLISADTEVQFTYTIQLWSPFTVSFETFLLYLQQESKSCTQPRGHRLADGPWTYQLSASDKANQGGWKCLKDKDQYDQMLLDLEMKTGHLIITHVRPEHYRPP